MSFADFLLHKCVAQEELASMDIHATTGKMPCHQLRGVIE